jgi:rfaE bifunctional protein kinase chain/domain
MGDLERIITNKFAGKRIVIVGDLVADQFLGGSISRISREAPVFILRHEQTETVPGAAANAAANVASLGGSAVLVGLAGEDANGRLLLEKLASMGVETDGIVVHDSITTTTKVRVIAGQRYAARQQVIRIDYENTAEITEGVKAQLIKNLVAAAAAADAIVVSDYGCGSVSDEVFAAALTAARSSGVPLILDSRYRLTQFTGATTATPNREEVEMVLGKGFTDANCAELRESLGCESLLVTNGSDGMLLFERNKPALRLDAVGSKEPVDVTGAGDTVIAAYSLALASGLDFADAARIANHAGGIVVMKKGTAVVTPQELRASIASNGASHASTPAH